MLFSMGSAPFLLRSMVHDMTPCGSIPEVEEACGLPPQHKDVFIMEHKASHDRLDRLAPVLTPMTFIADLQSQILTAAALTQVDEEDRAFLAQPLHIHNQAVVRTIVQGHLAALLDMGAIKIADGDEDGA